MEKRICALMLDEGLGIRSPNFGVRVDTSHGCSSMITWRIWKHVWLPHLPSNAKTTLCRGEQRLSVRLTSLKIRRIAWFSSTARRRATWRICTKKEDTVGCGCGVENRR